MHSLRVRGTLCSLIQKAVSSWNTWVCSLFIFLYFVVWLGLYLGFWFFLFFKYINAYLSLFFSTDKYLPYTWPWKYAMQHFQDFSLLIFIIP